MIKIYGQAGTRSTRVLWALEEAGAHYEFITVDLGKGDARQEVYLKLNPGGKVPSLVHNDLVLTESAAICTYIGDLFPDSKLVPTTSNSSNRARYNQACYFAMTELEQALWSMAKHRFALPKKFRIREMITTATYEYEKALDVFSLRLGDRQFLVGDDFTCADIITASILKWATQGGKRALSLRHENVERYLDEMLARDAFVRALNREQKS